ncbi:GAF domain-containing protein [Candidatus Solirubrobacter pratensis]|uniref:GAF domain-containing protein n=1 Tax=Candidatus Solirubrobacter pratensis TaxID=1298857 RepID=UPI00040CFDED|nr:GAF domain-containing protein [Candidatus Solirubrobacter pratensis]
MPYLTCPSCTLPTYVVSEGLCPACGTRLKARRAGAGPLPGRFGSGDAVRAELAMVCRELDMDTALVAEVTGGREVVRWAAGEGEYASVSAPMDETICQRLLDGRIGALVPDTAAEPSLRTIERVRDGSIAAYIGVPFTTADARLYVLCCLAREARPDLGEADVRFLRGLAESIRSLLEPAAPLTWV